VNKTSIGIGAVMLAAAAVFIYFDDPLYVRIIAAVIFVAGAALLYQTLSHSMARRRTVSQTSGTGRKMRATGTALADGRRSGGRHRGAKHAGGAIGRCTRRDSTRTLPFRHRVAASGRPTAEFDFLTNKLLQAAKDHVLAHTLGLYWINIDREQIIIGEFVTDSGNFTTARRLNLGNDLISQVGLDGKPAVVSDLSPASESDLVIYYDAAEGIRSFIAVPMFSAARSSPCSRPTARRATPSVSRPCPRSDASPR
jgi:hypothetical protein